MVDHVFIHLAAAGFACMVLPQAAVGLVLEYPVRYVWAFLWAALFTALCGDWGSGWRHQKWSLCWIHLVGSRHPLGYRTLCGQFFIDVGIVPSCSNIDGKDKEDRDFLVFLFIIVRRGKGENKFTSLPGSTDDIDMFSVGINDFFYNR